MCSCVEGGGELGEVVVVAVTVLSPFESVGERWEQQGVKSHVARLEPVHGESATNLDEPVEANSAEQVDPEEPLVAAFVIIVDHLLQEVHATEGDKDVEVADDVLDVSGSDSHQETLRDKKGKKEERSPDGGVGGSDVEHGVNAALRGGAPLVEGQVGETGSSNVEDTSPEGPVVVDGVETVRVDISHS